MDRSQKHLLPPDLYSRNTVIAFLIEKLVGLGDIRVLDVGGYGGKLSWFLPQNIHVTVLDKLDPPENEDAEYRQGDALKIPYSDGNFDIGVSSDLLEHVDQQDRTNIIKEMLRVSKNHLILGVPCASEVTEKAEQFIKDQFKEVTGSEHPFLIEHSQFGLPKESKIDEVIEKQGLKSFKIKEGNIMNWYIQQLYSGTQHEFNPSDEKYSFYKYFNQNLGELDTFKEPTYRTIFCIAKQGEMAEESIKSELPGLNNWNPQTYMEALRCAFSDLRQVVAAQKEKVNYLEKSEGTQGDQLAALQDALNKMRKDYEDAIARDEHSQKLLSQKESQIQLLEETIGKARESVKVLKGAVEEARGFLQEKEKTVQFLKGILEQKDKKITELESTNEKLSEELQANEKFIKELHEQSQKKDDQINYLRNHVINKEDLLEEQKKELQTQNSELLETKINLENHQHELRTVLNSRAWKVISVYSKIKQRIFVGPAKLIKNGWKVLTHLGPGEFGRRVARKIKRNPTQVANQPYQEFIQQEKTYSSAKKSALKQIKSWEYKPTVSIVLPVYNVKEEWLKECIESIQKQWYDKWELCICDDASTDEHIKPYLEKVAGNDKRIKVTYRATNGGIVKASNAALKLASGAYVGFVDCDDVLEKNALFEVVKNLQETKYDFVYSDEDKLDKNGNRCDPFFKPDWSPDLILSQNFICHFAVYRRKIITELDGLRDGLDGSQDYDLVLRVTEKTNKIKHIPKILYHWRKVPGSTAAEIDAKPYTIENAKKALTEALKRRKVDGEVTDGKWQGSYRVRRKISGKPRVSIIIPFKDKVDVLKHCVESILTKSTYENYEIILVNNQSDLMQTDEYLETLKDEPKIRILNYNEPFNFSAINNFAAKKAKGTYLILLNNDTEVITPEWIENMLEHAQRKEVGAVGAQLLFPSDQVQHAGVLVGIGGIANHAFLKSEGNEHGYFGQKDVIKNYSAVTGACIMIRKSLYEEIGGLDEQNLGISFNDIDFCLRLREKGYLIVYTPYAQLYHHESLSRGYDVAMKEIQFMERKYRPLLKHGDPYYNKNLTRERFDFSLRVEDKVQS